MKTTELTGAALDWAVAKANGWIEYPTDSIEQGAYWHTDSSKAPFGRRVFKEEWNPSTDWAQGGPIIEREWINVIKHEDGTHWIAADERWKLDDGHPEVGPTPLIAAMRCYVASKLGDEVDVPKELL